MSKHKEYRDHLKNELSTLFDLIELKENQKQYMRGRWMDQVLWMESRAVRARDWYYRLRLTTIIGGVIIPILVSLNLSAPNQRQLSTVVRAITIGLGGIVAISSAVEEFFHYGERWRHYRRSVESLKTQGWQFSQLTGTYGNYKTHGDAFRLFTMQVEDIIQRDVEVYASQVVDEAREESDSQEAAMDVYTAAPTAYTNPAP